MDISNYAAEFFDEENWNFKNSLIDISNFVKAANNSGYRIIGFVAN